MFSSYELCGLLYQFYVRKYLFFFLNFNNCDCFCHVGVYLDVLRITFFIRLEALALKAISIKSLGERSKKMKIPSRFSTTVRSSRRLDDKETIQGFPVKDLGTVDSVTLSNALMSATFRADNGMLRSIKTRNGQSKAVLLELKRYETISSGAYLFRPKYVSCYS